MEGDYCDHCKPDTFGLSLRNPLGCSRCYCYGLTHFCTEAQGLIRMWVSKRMCFKMFNGWKDKESLISSQLWNIWRILIAVFYFVPKNFLKNKVTNKSKILLYIAQNAGDVTSDFKANIMVCILVHLWAVLPVVFQKRGRRQSFSKLPIWFTRCLH